MDKTGIYTAGTCFICTKKVDKKFVEAFLKPDKELLKQKVLFFVISRAGTGGFADPDTGNGNAFGVDFF